MLTSLPLYSFAQYPLGGLGTFNFLHLLATATSDTPNRDATSVVGLDQTKKYKSSLLIVKVFHMYSN